MNREILFKARSINNGEWLEGDLITRLDAQDIEDNIIRAGIADRTSFGQPFIVDMNTVCQFTGLFDKNGKKIFEGDIVKENNREYSMLFSNGSFVLCSFEGFFYQITLVSAEFFEIIGNIHNNQNT